MKTSHQIFFDDSKNMNTIPSESISLVVTSPPYPMIKMWDDMFIIQNPAIGKALKKRKGPDAFELMHRILDVVWNEVYRVLKNGGIACINIGDATRTINDNFSLYQNHTRIMSYLLKLGFSALPAILWRKQTNAPNKFMGSGMLPPGAYVTLEHEYILIVRKGHKREFNSFRDKQTRRQSAFFWEERNVWFSDIWLDVKGAFQNLFDNKARNRSAAYPFEVPYRLINMFSVKGDTVLDPFLGIGTTMFASMTAGRNSIGFELDKNIHNSILSGIDSIIFYSNGLIYNRLSSHLSFLNKKYETGKKFKYLNQHYGFPVVTNQEKELLINSVLSLEEINNTHFEIVYSEQPQTEFCGDWKES
ncbi:MAG: site-specific DNA-methyltransferase [Deltaproteobacteria bacterium]|jgi:DNA modification methylase|nr:site-specific DNA-methyltransferase [Deltaproteobacteria bacterium]